MTNANLYLTFAQQSFSHADDRIFLQTPGREPLLYGQLDGLTAQLQHRLIELGVKKGDRVMVQVAKSYEALILYLACLRAGAIYIPLNTAYTAAEVDYFMADATPQVVVCDPRGFEALKPVADKLKVPHLLTLSEKGEGSLQDHVAELPAEADVVAVTTDDLAAILYTSGTTGRSKGAMLSHENLRSNAQVLHDYWQWQDGEDVLLHALPIFHVHGLFVALHCALLGTSTVHFLPKYEVNEIMRLIPESTVMMGVPTFYTRLLDEENFDQSLVSNMRLFISGSAPMLAETHYQFTERTGLSILERYGMTEAGMITSNPYDGDRVPGTVGFALPGVQIRVADDEGNVLSAGETGVLEVIGPNVFKGYWQMPEKTAAEFRKDGWFITGDLSTMDKEGRVSIVGRAKDLIISGGYNIYPKEIEGEIDLIPGVKESAVIGVPHKDFGEGVTAVVVADGSADISESVIVSALDGKLARFKQPKRVYIVDELPRNTMGKVQKAQLREQYQDSYAS